MTDDVPITRESSPFLPFGGKICVNLWTFLTDFKGLSPTRRRYAWGIPLLLPEPQIF